MAEGVPTNNQRGRRSGPCRLWGGLDKARHIVPTALLVRVQCFRKSLHKAVQGPSTRPIVVSMINGSYCRRRRRLTIFEPDLKQNRHWSPPPSPLPWRKFLDTCLDIIKIQLGSEELWPGHGFSLCVYCDLDIRDTSLGQGHATPFGHG